MSGDQSELFDKIEDHTREGAVWWAGNWQCRNWRGYLQHREGGSGAWCFIVHSFGGEPDRDGTAHIYRVDGKQDVPIDAHNRILVCGRRYGRDRWTH